MKITAPDFFGGFFCALRVEEPTIDQFECGDKFNIALEAAFNKFRELSEAQGDRPNFRVRLDPLHKDSKTIEEGLLTGIRSDFIGLDNPDFEKFRLKILPKFAEELLPKLPGSPNLYYSAARKFLDLYKGTHSVG